MVQNGPNLMLNEGQSYKIVNLKPIMILRRWDFINGLLRWGGKYSNANIWLLGPINGANRAKFKAQMGVKIPNRQF